LKRIIIAVLYILIAVVDFFFKAPRGPVTDQGGTGVFPPVPHVRCRRVAPHRATTLASPSGIVGISPTLKKPAVSGRALEIGGQELYGFAGSGGGAGLTGGGCVISWVGAGATLSWLPHIPDSYP